MADYVLYLEVKGYNLKGRCQFPKYKDWFEVDTIAFGVSNPGERGRPLGTATAADFTFSMPASQVDADLLQACASGADLVKCEVHLLTTVGEGAKVWQIYMFEEGFVSGWHISGTGGRPHVSVSINYRKFSAKTYWQEEGKDPKEPHDGGWDLKENKKYMGSPKVT
ncbi:MAG: hypothetical protein C4297_12780 [Gemmataceae bacterium]